MVTEDAFTVCLFLGNRYTYIYNYAFVSTDVNRSKCLQRDFINPQKQLQVRLIGECLVISK